MALRRGDSRDAVARYRACLADYEKAAEADSDSAVTRRDLAVIWYYLGMALEGAGEPDAARDALVRSLTIREELARRSPAGSLARLDQLPNLLLLGNLEQRRERYDEARSWNERATALLQQLAAAGQQHHPMMKVLRPMLESLTEALDLAGRAREDLGVALTARPEVSRWLLGLRGQALARRGRTTEAAATADLLADRAGEDPLAWLQVAFVRSLLGRSVPALVALRQAARILPAGVQDWYAYTELAPLRGLPEYQELLKSSLLPGSDG